MTDTYPTLNELPVILFDTQEEWEQWLEENHSSPSGVWLRLAKKASGLQSVSYAEAVESALCYGWIDGHVKRYDEVSWIQKFTPRRPQSNWSKINTEKVQKLTESGRMRPSGIKEVERAKADGRWNAAYDSPSKATVPDDLQEALNNNERAAAFFATLSGSNRYAILFKIQTAKKAETRARRIQQCIEMLEKHEKPH